MMYSYGTTQQGPYHIQKNIVCQDFHYIKKVSDSCIIAAVADGLGSEEHSDVASKIAATEAVEYCVSNLPSELNDDKVLQLLSDSFMHALQKITDTVATEKGDINQYDTTLCLAIYSEDTVYFGQSGDSGAIVLCKDGHYEGITKQQRDENGCVFPLAFGKEKWVFGVKTEVASLLLATDGILEIFYPALLHSEKVNIYIALAQFFMDNQSLKFYELGEETVQQKMTAFVQNIPEKQVNDDKTVLVVVNDSVVPARMEDEYYQVPNWAELQKKRQEEFNKLAYPHLYAKQQGTEESKNSEEENKSDTSEGESVIQSNSETTVSTTETEAENQNADSEKKDKDSSEPITEDSNSQETESKEPSEKQLDSAEPLTSEKKGLLKTIKSIFNIKPKGNEKT